jgi:tetratricopeptide (TPR) repeat protein
MLARFGIAVALVAAFAPTALAGDIIQRKDGTFTPAVKGDTPSPEDFEASNWQIIAADSENVTYQMVVAGKPQTMKFRSVDVLEIWMEPKDYPGGWKEAMNALASGDYASAARGFQSFGAEARINQVVRQKAYLNAARSVAATGKAADAESAYAALLKAFPNTFYVTHVDNELSEMFMDAGEEAKARAAAEALLKRPGVSEADTLKAKFLLTTIDFRKAVKDKDQAGIQKVLDQFKSMAQATAGKKEQAGVSALARIGMGNCMLELGNAKEAKGLFEEISATAKEIPVCAAAFNGLGECWFRQNDKQGWEEARRCFLRTIVLYTDGTPPDQVAKALYFAGECFYRLQDSDDWKDRARRELGECFRRFPSSPWAQKARQLLPAVPK